MLATGRQGGGGVEVTSHASGRRPRARGTGPRVRSRSASVSSSSRRPTTPGGGAADERDEACHDQRTGRAACRRELAARTSLCTAVRGEHLRDRLRGCAGRALSAGSPRSPRPRASVGLRQVLGTTPRGLGQPHATRLVVRPSGSRIRQSPSRRPANAATRRVHRIRPVPRVDPLRRVRRVQRVRRVDRRAGVGAGGGLTALAELLVDQAHLDPRDAVPVRERGGKLRVDGRRVVALHRCTATSFDVVVRGLVDVDGQRTRLSKPVTR